MSLRGFWRNLRVYKQPKGELTIDLMGEDLLDLSVVIISLTEAELLRLGWQRADQRRVYEALVAYSFSQCKRGKQVGKQNEPEPVTLSEEDWKRVFGVALEMKNRKPHDWPIRVIARIAAETAKVYPKVGGKRDE